MDGSNLLTAGLYTVADAVRLLRGYDTSKQKVRGWVAGYPQTAANPVIHNEVGFVSGRLAMGFVSLMEVRFVAYFARQGIRVSSIRHMAVEARQLLQHEHPFATKAIFATDGKKIFARSAEETRDRRMYDLSAKNWAFYDIMADSLRKGVEFDPSGTANTWRPAEEIAPNVILDPRLAFGQPVLDESGVPTQALFDAFNAESETYESVAFWYEIPVEHVRQAVRFETEYSRAA